MAGCDSDGFSAQVLVKGEAMPITDYQTDIVIALAIIGLVTVLFLVGWGLWAVFSVVRDDYKRGRQ